MENEIYYDVEKKVMIEVEQRLSSELYVTEHSPSGRGYMLRRSSAFEDVARFLRVPKIGDPVVIAPEGVKGPALVGIFEENARLSIMTYGWKKEDMPTFIVTLTSNKICQMPLYAIAETKQEIVDRATSSYNFWESAPFQGDISDFKITSEFGPRDSDVHDRLRMIGGPTKVVDRAYENWRLEILKNLDVSLAADTKVPDDKGFTHLPKFFGEPVVVVKSHIPSLTGRTLTLSIFTDGGAYVEATDENGRVVFLSRGEYEQLEVVPQHQAVVYYTKKGITGRPWEPRALSTLAKKPQPWRYYTPQHCPHCGCDTGCMCPPKEK